jgi:hypothetical protein
MDHAIKYSNQANSAIAALNELTESNMSLVKDSASDLLANQDTVQVSMDSLRKDSVPMKPTYEQIRYWHWQREKKLLINDSRYIVSKSGNELVLLEEVEQPTIILPNRTKSHFSNDWLTIVLMLALVLIASVRLGYAKYISSLFQSVFNYPTAFRMFGEKNNSILHGAVRLEILFYIIFAMFIFQIFNLSPNKSASASLVIYGTTLGFSILYFVVKKLVYKTLGMIFQGVSETSEFIFNMDNFNRVTGILLFPVVALVAFYPAESPVIIVFAGIFAAVFIYVMLLIRGVSILLKKQFSIFYLFLYLCTLEFLPLLLIYKVVV